jgi:hypothetical protein
VDLILPWIIYEYAGAEEIPDVASDDNEVMHLRSCGNKKISGRASTSGYRITPAEIEPLS